MEEAPEIPVSHTSYVTEEEQDDTPVIKGINVNGPRTIKMKPTSPDKCHIRFFCIKPAYPHQPDKAAPAISQRPPSVPPAHMPE